MGDDVDRPHIAGESASDGGDRFVGRFVAVAAVEFAEIFETEDRNRKAGIAGPRIGEARLERVGERAPLRQTSDVADARRFFFGDKSHQTMGPRRTAARLGGPTAKILDRHARRQAAARR